MIFTTYIKTERLEMKIKVENRSYDEVIALPKITNKEPKTPKLFFRLLLQALSLPEVLGCRVKYNRIGMEELGKEPALILMNHSSFIDLKIATMLFRDRPMNIVCTSDGFIGQEGLMRAIGCIPTQKFVADFGLIRDIRRIIKTNRCSVLMYPEASYSFDGRATRFPDTLAKLIKMLGVPVVTVITHGAFARQPLYNNLHRRKVNIDVDVKYLVKPEEARSLSAEEIDERLQKEFTFDNFKWQKENMVRIADGNRAEGLERVLYKCPHCEAEGRTKGEGTRLICEACGTEYELGEYGELISENAKFTSIPDWYEWERECVREEFLQGSYSLNEEVDIWMMADYNAIYKVGEGRLTHDESGFTLKGCDGKLSYFHPAQASYSIYSDFYWYERGDVVCIGDKDYLYYCFPKGDRNIVAKTRLAAEELYKLKKQKLI